MEYKGLRFNQGKLRYDLVHPWAHEQMVNVLTEGAKKYTINFENEWEKLLVVANVKEIRLNIAKECVAHVMKDNLGKTILNTQKDKGLILGNGQRNTEEEKENWIKLEELIQNLDSEIKEQNGEYISENLVLPKSPTRNYVKTVVKCVEEKNICTLTTTTQQGNLEESYVVDATTVSECLEMTKQVLEKHLNISFNQVVHKNNGERNWEKGMAWSNALASLKRHLTAIEKGEDYDSESGLLHAAHIACNAHFLTAYYKIYPQGDDRPHSYLTNVKIGLDIDEVLCDWVGDWTDYRKLDIPKSWYFDRGLVKEFEIMKKENRLDDFYMGLKPLISPDDIPFEPHCYITSRPVDTKVTEDWLDKNGFPSRPVHTVSVGKSKVDIAKEEGLDIFVDDGFHNFTALNNAGICCFLMDAPHNQRYDVGYKRIKSLKELV